MPAKNKEHCVRGNSKVKPQFDILDLKDSGDADNNSFRSLISKKYSISGKPFGQGSYGSVSKGQCRVTGRLVALKIMEDQAHNQYDCIKLLREI